jgi:hypothetical protein
MKAKAIVAVALMLAVSFALVVPMDSSDADFTKLSLEGGNKVSMEKGDEITLHVDYTSTSMTTLRVIVYDKAGSMANPVYKQDVTFKVGDHVLDIPFTCDKDSSPVYMRIAFMQGSTEVDHIDFEVNYTSSIWSNPALYVAIIVVVILVIALVVYKSRTAPKRDKSTLTFEQIEAERQAQKSAAPKKEAAPSAAKSERQKYLASKKKKE